MENNPENIKIKEFMATNPPLPPGFKISDLLYPENPTTVNIRLIKVSRFFIYRGILTFSKPKEYRVEIRAKLKTME